MIIQTISMAFWYNSGLTFQILEQLSPESTATKTVFIKLMSVLPKLKHDFELRRLIFGLTAIVSTAPQAMPGLVSEKLPLVMKELAVLC